MINRLALSGRFRAGKDYVAEKAGYQILSFAEPMYRVLEYYLGHPCDKTKQDQREFLQIIGQWGWGAQNEKYILSIPRYLFVQWIKSHGHEIPDTEYVNWAEYGTRRDFWVHALISRLEQFPQNARVAVTNVRFAHEWESLQKAGFEQYLVRCTEATRAARNGGSIPKETDSDISEQYAKELEQKIPPNRVIWNDSIHTDQSASFLTVDEFVLISHG